MSDSDDIAGDDIMRGLYAQIAKHAEELAKNPSRTPAQVAGFVSDAEHSLGQIKDLMEMQDCNCCGFSLRLPHNSEHRRYRHGLLDQVVTGGYESTPGNGDGALDDCTSYKFSMCEFCLDWLFERFVLPPLIYTHGDGEGQYRPAWVRVRDDEWRHQKEEFSAEKARRDEARARRARSPYA